jgi:polyhydroxyalkanoate synthesis regulator phasin
MEEQQQEKMNSLVEQGLINQDQANQLLALQDEKAEERKAKMEELKNMTAEERKAFREENKEAVKPEKGQGLYSEAVEAGILTQDEVDTIQQKMQESRKAEMQEKQDEIFAALINQGTITQAQADTIQAYLEEEAENRKAEFEKIKDLSREERKEYLEDNKESKKGLLNKLVEEGTITQEQADEIAKLLHKGRP